MSTRKFQTRRLRERKHKKLYSDDLDFVDDELEAGRGFSLQEKLDSPKFSMDLFVLQMTGNEVTVEYFQRCGFQTPILVIEKSGLGLCVPTQNFTVNDVKVCVGSKRLLDVMDVNTQKNSEMTMKEWTRYYNDPNKNSLLNVISLEFSHTKLETYVRAPSIVRQMDWVDQAWPRELKMQQVEATNIINQMMYPKVQKYCLMSVKGCYTDFHIDFGGTSVWYHILKGQKVFWLIPPTAVNLELYEKWVLSGKQADTFFGDTVEKCGRVHLTEGNTFFIPTGWIHAVYTPRDSLVFGGNFLHSFGIEMQIKIAQVENRTKVPQKFRYPFFNRMLWYVLDKYVNCLLGRSHILPKNEQCATEIRENIHLTKYEYDGLKAIIYYLLSLPLKKLETPVSIENPSALIEDVHLLLKLHWDDDRNLAITGRSIFDLSGDHVQYQTPKKASEFQNRVQCGQCEPCEREECTECENCLKNREQPPLVINKEFCILKTCQAPILSASNICKLCSKGDLSVEDVLMECTICNDITHITCLEKSNENIDGELNAKNGTINEDLSSSWECPKCTKYYKVVKSKKKNHESKVVANSKTRKNQKLSVKNEAENDDDDDDEYVAELSCSSTNSSESDTNENYDLDLDLYNDHDDGAIDEIPARRRKDDKRKKAAKSSPTHQRNLIRLQIAEEIIKNTTKTLRQPIYVVRPAPIDNHKQNRPSEFYLDKTCMLAIFRYLTPKDLITCSLVCKQWAKYSIDPVLWRTIDLTHQSFTANLLKSIVRRCPETLILDWTKISKVAFQWLLLRLNNIRRLSLRGFMYDTVSVLSSCGIPHLITLDLSYVTGLTDMKLRDILKPFHDIRLAPVANPKSRLCNLQVFKVAGTDISDASVLHIVEELKAVCELDLSCTRITDSAIEQFALRPVQTLRKLNLSCCKLVTDACLDFLHSCVALTEIDFRSCHLVTTGALIKFATQSKHPLMVQDTKLVTKRLM